MWSWHSWSVTITSILPHQIPVHQPLAHHPGDYVFHLAERVEVADVVPAAELVDVPLEMLGADLVEGSRVGPLEHGPEALHAVSVRHSPDVLADRVLDRLVIRQVVVGQGVVGVDAGSGFDVLYDELGDRLACGVWDHAGGDLIAGPVLDSGDSGFPNGSPSSQSLPLLVAHVLPLAAEVALIRFDGPRKGRPFGGEGFSDALLHEPGRFLADPDIPVSQSWKSWGQPHKAFCIRFAPPGCHQSSGGTNSQSKRHQAR